MPGNIKRLALVAAGFCVVAALCFLTPADHVEWKHVCGMLLLIPVAGGAVYFGWPGGLAAGMAGAVISFRTHFGSQEPDFPAVTVEVLLYPAAGAIAGWLRDRAQRRRLAWESAVTQLKAQHNELRDSFEGMKRAERLFSLGQLSAGLAHEIRNPLASIAGAVRILRRSVPSGPKQIECLDIIEKESQRLNRLLTNFLDFARPRLPQFQPVDISSVFDTVMTLAAHGLSRDNVELRKEVEPSLPFPECDAEQLQQVLLNLTINAIQASSESGEVVLAARRGPEDEVLIEVRDQGTGVPPENVDRLFDPFFTTKENGTGLGLPVAHEIVRQFGGTLSPRRNPDRGMTFSILLPIRRQGIHEPEANPSR
jgi:signal transduction histidine kinase